MTTLIIVWILGIVVFGIMVHSGSKDYQVMKPYKPFVIVWPIVLVIAIIVYAFFWLTPKKNQDIE
jgi:hypothetical protein